MSSYYPVSSPLLEQANAIALAKAQTYYDSLDQGLKTTTQNQPSNKPPQWFKNYEQNHKDNGGGGGGGGYEGANAIPNMNLPPTVTTGAPSSGTSPLVIVIVLAALGIGAWYLWHKFHKTKEEDKLATQQAGDK